MIRSTSQFYVRVLSLLTAWLACACNVGAALVDRQEQGKLAGPHIRCNVPPACDTPEIAIPMLANRAQPIALAQWDDCVDATDSALCEPDWDSADAGSAAAGDQNSVASQRCSTLSALPPTAACAVLLVEPDTSQPLDSLDAANWSHSNLTIAASHPFRVELHAPSLDTVFLRLEGPVVLHIDHAGALQDLRISGIPTAAGGPSIELIEANGHALSIGDSERSFAGALLLRDVKLSNSVLAVTQLQLESVAVNTVQMIAETLMGSDVSLVDTSITADSLLISSFTSSHSRLHSCAGATYVAGKINSSAFSGCDGGGAIRLYDSDLLSSILDGAVESDGSNWENVRFGATLPSDALLFESGLSAVSFCDKVGRVAIGTSSEIKCSDCASGFDASSACIVPSTGPAAKIADNWCALLTDDAAHAICPDPLPERVRPVDPRGVAAAAP